MNQPSDIASVSVIIPCYRHAKSLGRAVESVALQSLPVMEIIIVNDGADATVNKEVEKLRVQFGRHLIQLVALPINLGAGEARNAGWKIAKGKFIAFLDADDAWHPQKIAIQYAFMNANPDIGFSGHSHRQEDSLPDWSCYHLSEEFELVGLKKLLFFNQFITPSVMIKNNPNFRFAQNQRYMEDFGLWLNLALSGVKVAKLDAELACIFKDPFGQSGLSSNLLKMEWGELLVYLNAAKLRPSLYPALAFLYPFSLVKFSRRIILGLLRQH